MECEACGAPMVLEGYERDGHHVEVWHCETPGCSFIRAEAARDARRAAHGQPVMKKRGKTPLPPPDDR